MGRLRARAIELLFVVLKSKLILFSSSDLQFEVNTFIIIIIIIIVIVIVIMSSSISKQLSNIPKNIDGFDERLNSLIDSYLKQERIDEHKQTIERLVQSRDVKQLELLLCKRLSFGTAGIRGRMGPGYGRMNDLVVIQTAQGIASYLLELDCEKSKEQGVIIGHDARHNSARFARLAALAFLQKGIRVYLVDYIVPTPLVAFGVVQYSCRAGLMVTASHNPKEDNGMKVYWHNGAQILAPHDKQIQEHILRQHNQNPWPKAWDFEILNSIDELPNDWSKIFIKCYGHLTKQYFSYINSLVGSESRRMANQASKLSITYTPMHGVGNTFLAKAFEIAGFNDYFPVEAQKGPDPDFSTVKFPNPEEAGALNLAFETARLCNSNLIIANDPDSDRCAVALFDPSSKRKRVLNGNEIGALLGWWLWHQYVTEGPTSADDEASTKIEVETFDDSIEQKVANKLTLRTPSAKKAPSDCYMISTAVSSKFLHSMAQAEGFNFVETLTGFKYMGNLTDELINQHGKHVVFAYEEAIGYMVDASILDKDGISAALQVAQCASYLLSEYGRTLEDQLDWLYEHYGYHYSLNSYYICTDQSVIERIFRDLQSNYPKQFRGSFLVKRVRDLNNSFDSATRDRRPSLPCSSSSFMVTFFVDNDITLTFRTSGTEPKIKYYSEIVAKFSAQQDSQRKEKAAARQRLANLLESAIEVCLRPNEFNLEPADS